MTLAVTGDVVNDATRHFKLRLFILVCEPCFLLYYPNTREGLDILRCEDLLVGVIGLFLGCYELC